MFNLLVKDVMESRKVLMLPPAATVPEAARAMVAGNVGAVMVVDGEHLLGIFTERDALFRVTAPARDPASTCLREVMTANPGTVMSRQSYGSALLMMFEGGYRHAPVLEDGKLIGIVSARNAMDPELEQFAAEVCRREALRGEALRHKTP